MVNNTLARRAPPRQQRVSAAAVRNLVQRVRAAAKAPARPPVRAAGKAQARRPMARPAASQPAANRARMGTRPRATPPAPPLSLSAFSEAPIPRMLSEARSKLCKGGQARQFGTSYGQLVPSTGSDYSTPIGPLPQAALTLTEPYPTTVVCMPSNSPVLYRVYAPVVYEISDQSGGVTYELAGLTSEDYGSTALGTQSEYAQSLKNRIRSDEDEANGKIVDLSTARHSFRIRNVTPAIGTGGTVRTLRQATGFQDPLHASTYTRLYYGSDNGNAYYRKAVCIDIAGVVGSGTAALARFTTMLENLANSTNFVATSGKQYATPHEGSCTVVDQIKGAQYRKEGQVSEDARMKLASLYGTALPGFRVALEADMTLPLIALRTGLLEGKPVPPAPSYALTWTQAELRTNMLSGAAFPLDPWPNFGNIGFTQDPLALIGLKMRYPASGGETFVVVHVDPAVPDNAGFVYFNQPDSANAPEPEEVPETGFSPEGSGWDVIDVQNLLTSNTQLLVGLRFRDNVASTVYMILRASKSAIEAVVDGPLVATPPQGVSLQDSDPDPFTADLLEPNFTPFITVLEAIPGASGGNSGTGTAYVNTYELTARAQQFAHFTPGSLLANDQKPQPAAPAALRRAKDAEERKGSWLSRVTSTVFRAARRTGRWAWRNREGIGAVAGALM